MGGLLAVPIAFASALLTLPKKGIFHGLCYLISSLYLTIQNVLRKKRFDLYDGDAEGQPEKNGFFIPKEEWEIEPPNKDVILRKYSDAAFFYGTNSKSECLAVSVSRQPSQQVLCSVILKLANGKTYSLPEEYHVQAETPEDNTFGSSRLKLQCLLPMRKWRIFFNGILREHTSRNEGESNVYKHVRFTFIWTASSDVFDFSTDLSVPLLSDYLASARSWTKALSLLFFKKLNKFFNCYEQPGMILGTLTVENEPEQELYLWGARRRNMGKIEGIKYKYCLEVNGNFKNGLLLQLNILDVSAITNRFVYGYVMKPNGYVSSIDKVEKIIFSAERALKSIIFYANKELFTVEINDARRDDITFRKELAYNSIANLVDMTINGKIGRGIILERHESDFVFPNLPKNVVYGRPISLMNGLLPILSIPFKDQLCQKSELCGGKGSSLGNLFALSISKTRNRENIKFKVPRGIVVTTDAYKEFIKGDLKKSLRKFEKLVWSKTGGDVPSLCNKVMNEIKLANLPEHICKSIAKNLKSVFGESFSELKFAVRSSATGEDTEQMSAAGQMETFLGVKGINEILQAVKKCWASQFSFQAVEYKRGYGQLLNTPMAVAIQEMVNCEVAGVMFTCDPVTGNPLYISVTANWGLGESVVSASADPDTIILKRGVDNTMKVHSKNMGNKKSKIIMDGDSGVREIETSEQESSAGCVDDKTALALGKIAVEIENHYGSPRDIEFGIANGEIFLFQSRPVTSLDVETDFETKHIFDCFQRTEKAFVTKANVGTASLALSHRTPLLVDEVTIGSKEVMPGATTPLGIDIICKVLELGLQRQFMQRDKYDYVQKPYHLKGMYFASNHAFLTLLGGVLRFTPSNDEEVRSIIISWFGRMIDVTEMRNEALERGQPEEKKITVFIKSLLTNYMCYFAAVNGNRRYKAIENVHIPQDGLTASQILQQIGHLYDIAVEAMVIHINCSFSTSFWNSTLLGFLTKAEGDLDNTVFRDFAYLMSTCTDVESADVPAAIQDLGAAISKEINPDTFKKMSVEEAIHWLNNNKSKAGTMFKKFLDRHGHRCLKEFDVYAETWNINPTPLIEMLQNFVSDNVKASSAKTIESFHSVISKLQTKLTWKDRLRLRWLLPNARRGVRERENSKSMCIRMFDRMRRPFHRIAELMVEEGRLPRKELLFFLCVDEINQLIKTRSPRLVTKAIRRWKNHEALDKLIFPEICADIPKPINEKEEIQVSEKGFKLTGVPVSQGVVKGTARVVVNLSDANTIKQGDILIAYSTDIGWSPYFPLLSGVVTELGGLISHGAVVAREYGLPCIVSVVGATRYFKSGDVVILDGNTGILQKVEDD